MWQAGFFKEQFKIMFNFSLVLVVFELKRNNLNVKFS